MSDDRFIALDLLRQSSPPRIGQESVESLSKFACPNSQDNHASKGDGGSVSIDLNGPCRLGKLFYRKLKVSFLQIFRNESVLLTLIIKQFGRDRSFELILFF